LGTLPKVGARFWETVKATTFREKTGEKKLDSKMENKVEAQNIQFWTKSGGGGGEKKKTVSKASQDDSRISESEQGGSVSKKQYKKKLSLHERCA